MHDAGDFVDLDNIIDYAVMTHDAANAVDIQEGTTTNDTLVAYMAGRTNDTASSSDIRNVLAAKRSPDKGKPRKANESKSAPSTVEADGKTYYLNKGETISFQGNQYFTHMTMIPYRVSKHDVSSMDKALVYCGANGGICGDDMNE